MKKSIIQIKNKDNKCVARAIATGMLRSMFGVDSKEYDNAKRGRKIQEEYANNILTLAGLPLNEKVGIKELLQIEKTLPFQITLIDGDNFNNIIYPDIDSKKYNPPNCDDETIYLYKHKGHCDLIANNRLAGFFGKGNFCHRCKKSYKLKDKHRCKFKCNM